MAIKHHAVLAAIFTLSASLGSFALHAQPSGDRQRGHRGPPPEAIAACDNQAEQASCSFNGRRGDNLNGQCKVVVDDTLACVPEGHAERRGKRDTQE